MKIGVMSDTHDRLENVAKAIKIFQKEKVGLIIHCGDWVSPFVPQFIYSLKPRLTVPIKSIFGNNEGDHFRFLERKEKEKWAIEFYKESFEFEAQGKKVVVYHGSNPIITKSLISSKLYQAVFTGHTHKAVNEYVDEIFHLNPGTTSGYQARKITNESTVAIYNPTNNSAQIVRL